MSTFLRVWREQWVGLSRGQLALAVTSACRGNRRVAKHVIEAWERGQAPRTTAELEGLLAVMARHGMQETELGEFRTVVLAACAGRQYPELFGDESIAQRDDVTEIAEHAFFNRAWPMHRGSVVDLVVMVEDLRAATRDAAHADASRARQRRLQVALCLLLSALAHHHGYHHRQLLQGEAAGACADALQAFFGWGGLGGDLTPLCQRAVRAHALAHRQTPDAVHWARQLCDLHEEARARGRHADAAAIYCDLIDAVGELEAGAYPMLVEQGLKYVDCLPNPSVVFCKLTWAATAEMLPDQVDRHLPSWIALAPYPSHRAEAARVLGWLALGDGRHAEADEHFRDSVRVTEALGYHDSRLSEYIELCDRARTSRRPVSLRDYRLGTVALPKS